jgi:hypothetical protein
MKHTKLISIPKSPEEIAIIVIEIIILIFASISPDMPRFITNRLLKNMFFRGACIILIIFIFEKNQRLGLLLLIAFILILIKRYEQVVNDGFIDGIKEGMIDDSISDEIKSLDPGLQSAIITD